MILQEMDKVTSESRLWTYIRADWTSTFIIHQGRLGILHCWILLLDLSVKCNSTIALQSLIQIVYIAVRWGLILEGAKAWGSRVNRTQYFTESGQRQQNL